MPYTAESLKNKLTESESKTLAASGRPDIGDDIMSGQYEVTLLDITSKKVKAKKNQSVKYLPADELYAVFNINKKGE